MAGTSLGMIETRGYAAAISGADAGVKAANVEFLGYFHTSPALITIRFQGDVAAVQAAVHAASIAASAVGQVVAQLIIPRPDKQLGQCLGKTSPTPPAPKPTKKAKTTPQPASITEEAPAADAAPSVTPAPAPKRKRPATRKKRAPARAARATVKKTAATTPEAKTAEQPAPAGSTNETKKEGEGDSK